MNRALLALWAFSSLCTATVLAKPTNVVLFVVDDMGWMDSGVYGSEYYETPNIDQFAERAMRFTQAYANPLCSPSRASIMSGKHPTRHGILTASGHQPPQPPDFDFTPESASPQKPMVQPISKNYLDPSEYTLAEALRDAGYRTAHIGKWHLGLTPEYRPEQQGFDVAFHCAPDPGPPGEYFSPYGVVAEGEAGGKVRVGTVTDGPPGEYIVDRQASEAVAFMQANQDRPFFLNLWCYGVHGPWGHKEEYTTEFAKRTDPRGVQKNPIMASMLRSVDDCFGRILEEIEALGLRDDTLVVFYSDNGGNVHSNRGDDPKLAKLSPDHPKRAFVDDWRKWAGDEPPTNNHPLREGKSSLYEGGTRVPMMWALPDRIPVGVSEAVAGHIDIYPTILDLVGLQPKPDQVIDGVSLAPVLTESGALERKAFFNFFPFRPNEGGVTVVAGDFKLIRWFDPAVSSELYDLKQDIGETRNLLETNPDKAEELEALIDGFLEETNAPVPVPNPAFKPSLLAAAKAPEAGLVPKLCSIGMVDGALVVTSEPGKKNAFLGSAQIKVSKPLQLKLRARSAKGGAGKVSWKYVSVEEFEIGKEVSFELAAGEAWQDLTLDLPFERTTQLVRLYLPVDAGPVEIESIEYLEAKTGYSVRRWDFSK